MVDVSIIIVSWNAKKYLFECLQSLVNDTIYHNIEILVIDNGSIDGTPEDVKKYFPKVNLIVNNKNLGFSKANNIGIKKCRGKYVCLVNSDIKVLDNCIESMVSYMNRYSNIGIIGPKTFNADFTLQPTCGEFPTLWSFFSQAVGFTKIFSNSRIFKDSFMTYFDHNSIRSVQTLSGCFLMIRKEALDKIGLLDETFYIFAEDIDLCKRFKNEAWEIVFFPVAKVIHYGGASSSAAPIKFSLEMLKADFQYWGKYHKNFSLIIYFLIKLYHYAIRLIGGMVLYTLMKDSLKMKYKNKVKAHLACINWIFFNKLIKKNVNR